MKICIASSGRFYVLDLAKELSELGHDVTFYSYVPLSRAIKYGLPKECHVNLFPFLFPFLALQRFTPQVLNTFFNKIIVVILDLLVSIKLRRCDVFIAMSGMYVNSLKIARNKYKALIIIERASMHINTQINIVEKLRFRGILADDVPNFFRKRELFAYDFADLISVPSLHVVASFKENNIANEKIFYNPFGVDLKMFKPTLSPSKDSKNTIIFVGSWCYRKGVDVLSEAIRILDDYKFIHVGPKGDAPYPSEKNFYHFDPVDQATLRNFYADSHMLVLPSREEGLALVQAQALSCGLPIVCTDKTGGEDLKQLLGMDKWIKIVKVDDVQDLVLGLEEMMQLARSLNGLRDFINDEIKENISWERYAFNYSKKIEKSTRKKEFINEV